MILEKPVALWFLYFNLNRLWRVNQSVGLGSLRQSAASTEQTTAINSYSPYLSSLSNMDRDRKHVGLQMFSSQVVQIRW